METALTARHGGSENLRMEHTHMEVLDRVCVGWRGVVEIRLFCLLWRLSYSTGNGVCGSENRLQYMSGA